MKMHEAKECGWKKLAEYETTDFSLENIQRMLREWDGDDFETAEIEEMIKEGWIEIFEDGFIWWYDGI